MSSSAVGFVIGGVCLVVGVATGYVVSGVRTSKEMDRIVRENSELRRKYKAMAETFKNVNAAMINALADISSSPPRSIQDLKMRLSGWGLYPKQIDLIVAEVIRVGILKAA
jgi:hypothetical protein